jgi:hypothetical protein
MANQNSENQQDLQQQIEKNRMGDEKLKQKPGKPAGQQNQRDNRKSTPAHEDDPEQVDNVEGRKKAGTSEPDDDPNADISDEDQDSGVDAPFIDEDAENRSKYGSI